MRKTREERRRDRWEAGVRMLLVAAFLCVMLLILGLDTGPAPGATVDKQAATFAAARAYDAAMEKCGDAVIARSAAEAVYREAMEP